MKQEETKNAVEVKIGQLWGDNDPRENRRTLRVTGMIYDADHKPYRAICRVGATERYTKVAVRRLLSRAFTLLREDGVRVDRPTETGERP